MIAIQKCHRNFVEDTLESLDPGRQDLMSLRVDAIAARYNSIILPTHNLGIFKMFFVTSDTSRTLVFARHFVNSRLPFSMLT
jgi:hypothetical protein